MPPTVTNLPFRLIVLATTFCLSAFFSASETALFSLPPYRVKKMAEGSGAERLVARLLRSPKYLLSTLLFGNMVANVLFYSVSFLLIVELEPQVGRLGSVLLGLAALLCLVTFCEVTPKNVAVAFSAPLSRLVAPPLLLFQKVFWPFIRILEGVADIFTGLLGRHASREPLVTDEELQLLLELSEKEGVLDLDVTDMIAEVLRLSQVPVREVMLPRVEMVSFEVSEPVSDLLRLFRDNKLTWIPVYEETIDNVLGVVHVKDVFWGTDGKTLRELIRPVPFLPETASVEGVLRQLRERRMKTAFIVDEYGAVSGLVTIEDALEQIVGEIRDEYDAEEGPAVERIDAETFRLKGHLNIRDWSELFRVDLPQLSVDTVGGLVMTLLGRVPEAGDTARYHNLEFTVEKTRVRRVLSVILHLIHEPELAQKGS